MDRSREAAKFRLSDEPAVAKRDTVQPSQVGDSRGLSPEVQGVIADVLHPGDQTDERFFRHPRLGEVYRAYVISQFLDPRQPGTQTTEPPAMTAARIMALFHLTGAGSGWVQVYEHTGCVVAAAMTIGKRMRLDAGTLAAVRSAALLHDATKRDDVERHGRLASSLENTDRRLAKIMRRAGYPETTIAAAMNTGRGDRKFSSAELRRQSIASKGVVAAIVGLADTRSIGADFCSLPKALASYLERKKDRESQEFFGAYWAPYYRDVAEYLIDQCPGLDLGITNEDVYNETIFPEVFGANPSPTLRQRYSFTAGRPAAPGAGEGQSGEPTHVDLP